MTRLIDRELSKTNGNLIGLYYLAKLTFVQAQIGIYYNKLLVYIEYNCNYGTTNRDLENWNDFFSCHDLGVERPFLFIILK